MKFLELEIENFLAITGAKINLADRGLVLIQGINRADSSAMSNGAGKSTIADALSWVLYGVTARGESGDDIVNDKAGKNARVQIRILDGATTYRIVRHRKHKTGKNRLEVYQSNGLTETDLTKGTDKLTQDAVLKIIGASHDVFVGAIYAGQEKMPDLPSMTDKHLKLLIEEAAGVTVLEEAYKIAREDLRTAQIKRDDANGDLVTLTTRRSWLVNQLEVARNDQIHWSGKHTEQIAALTKTAVDLVNQAKAIDVSFNLGKAEDRLSVIDAKVRDVASENTEFTRLDRIANQAASALVAIQSRIARLHADLKSAKTAIDQVAHKVGCPCDECGRPLTESELDSAIASAQAKFRAVEVDLDKALLEEAHALEASKKAGDERDDFLLSMTDLSAINAERASLQREIDNHKHRVAQRDALLQRARDHKVQIEAMKIEVNPHDKQVKDTEKQIADIEVAIKNQTDKLNELQAQVDLETENVKTFGPAGARATILDEVTPFLNMQTAKYLSTLSDGNIEATWSTLTKSAKGELKEKFSIDVTNATGGKKFGLISGGEKKKVRVATALALQDLVATRAVKPIELFIGDEIDGALDPAGLERLTMVLEEKAAERGTVLVISHLELRDWISNVMQIEKSATGETTITEMAA